MTGLERLKARQAGTAPLPSNSNIIDLLSNPVAVANAHEEDVQQIDLMKLHDFGAHTFLLREDETYKALVSSITETGIRTPLLVRPYPVMGEFEIISGHRRRRAAQQAGLTTVPCIIVQLDDDAATILMAESNIQRPDWLPSEKAKTFAAWLTAVQKKTGISQGQRSDLTSGTEFPKLGSTPAGATSATELPKSGSTSADGTSGTEFPKSGFSPADGTSGTEFPKLGSTLADATAGTKFPQTGASPADATAGTEFPQTGRNRDVAAAKWGISGKVFSMYIKLCDLLPELLTMVDEKKLTVKAGYQLAFLTAQEQNMVLEFTKESGEKINPSKAEDIRCAASEHHLTLEWLESLFSAKQDVGKVSISFDSAVLKNKATVRTALNNADVLEKIEAIIARYAADHDLPLE